MKIDADAVRMIVDARSEVIAWICYNSFELRDFSEDDLHEMTAKVVNGERPFKNLRMVSKQSVDN